MSSRKDFCTLRIKKNGQGTSGIQPAEQNKTTLSSRERKLEKNLSHNVTKKTALVIAAVDQQSESLGLKQGCLTLETLKLVDFNSHAG